MSKYSNMFVDDPISAKRVELEMSLIEGWRQAHPKAQTSSKRISYILGGNLPSSFKADMISDIGDGAVEDASRANIYVDSLVNSFVELKESLKPTEKLILEALHLIEGLDKGKGLGRLLSGFKTAPDAIRIRSEVKDRIYSALQQFLTKLHFRVDPFLADLNSTKRTLIKVLNNLDETIDSLDYLYDTSDIGELKYLILKRKEMFIKSRTLMAINNSQIESMIKICQQKKTFAEELKLTVIPLMESIMRSSVINGNEDMQKISEVIRNIL